MIIPMATVRLGNASMLSNLVTVLRESVGLQRYDTRKVFAPMTFIGSCNRNLFEMWLQQCLIPQLQRGDVIVIDNARHFSDDSVTRKDAASFHRSQTIDEIVAEAGCELWYLPTYSPDLNKIEHWWFVLKNWMRQRWNEFDSFHDCVDAAFKYCPNVFP